MYTREVGRNTSAGEIYKKYSSHKDETLKEEAIDFTDPKDEFIHEDIYGQPKNVKILAKNEKFTISAKSTVTFNSGMRNAQINSAKGRVRIGRVMSSLNSDLRQVRAGVRSGACDISELRKVEAAIRRAKTQRNKITK